LLLAAAPEPVVPAPEPVFPEVPGGLRTPVPSATDFAFAFLSTWAFAFCVSLASPLLLFWFVPVLFVLLVGRVPDPAPAPVCPEPDWPCADAIAVAATIIKADNIIFFIFSFLVCKST
jgi:hypothetical protein